MSAALIAMNGDKDNASISYAQVRRQIHLWVWGLPRADGGIQGARGATVSRSLRVIGYRLGNLYH
jgi:hypothetical protein